MKRKIIEIDEELCDGCGECVSSCAEGAIKIVDGKARLVSDSFCDGLGACLKTCPTGALKVVEREAGRFDGKAVERHLRGAETREENRGTLPCGCPSSGIRVLDGAKEATGESDEPTAAMSALGHWPIQIKLIPPMAPFLRNASLLVAADCTAFAAPQFNPGLLKGRALMIGCPKLDDADDYVRKFKEIFALQNIRDVTVAVMEVPCCSMLPRIVRAGIEQAGKDVPMSVVTVKIKPSKPQFSKVEGR